MFFNNKKKQEQESEIHRLQQEAFVLEGNIKGKTEIYQKLSDDIRVLKEDLDSLEEQQVEKAEFVVDFEKLKPFSIERTKRKDAPGYKTIIGYFLTTNNSKEVKEWHLYCNLATHNRIAEEFKQYLQKDKPSDK